MDHNPVIFKKQIIYPKLIPRLFSMTIDLTILALVVTPIMNFLAPKIFLVFFQGYFINNNINIVDPEAVSLALRNPEFMNYISANNFFGYILIIIIIYTFIMGSYFVLFWKYKAATIGKILMNMQIVDKDTFNKPTTLQLIKRFLGYVTGLFGIFFIIFSKQRQALHDKFASTVVIKK